MTDQIKRDQEVIALRQLIEQTYANQPAIQDALRRNADELDLQLRQLPSGTSPAGAIEYLSTQQWFREADQATPETQQEITAPSNWQAQEQQYDPPLHPKFTQQEVAGGPNKRYIGLLLQYNPQISFWTLDWLLSLAANDLVKESPTWAITQTIGPHPIELNGKCFVASDPYWGNSRRGSIILRLSAIDMGLRVDQNGHQFLATQLDANFADEGRNWDALIAERIVAETLSLLYDTFTFAYTGPPKPFWYRVSGSWVCGRELYPCPDWQG
jgi:hypothetical protein